MLRVLSVAFAFVFSAAVTAQADSVYNNVASEIEGYKEIDVLFSEEAAKCKLADAAVYEQRVRDKFADMGIKDNPDSIAFMTLGITAFPYTASTCVANVDLQFRIWMTPADMGQAEAVQYVDAYERFPVIIYREALLLARPIDVMGHFVGTTIDRLADDFKTKRAR